MKPHVFQRRAVQNIRLHVLPTEQFKTYAISIYIGFPLSEDWVSSIALIPHVLRRGSKTYPETKRFRERLDDLYGAGFGFDVYKRGDYQIVHFRMDIIQDQFVQSNGSLLRQALTFLGEAITNPAAENGHFLEKYVESEKNVLTKKIESIVNDKGKYAAERCIEEMCKNEPYRLLPLGKPERIEKIAAAALYDRYLEWLQLAPIDIYVTGKTTIDEACDFVQSAFQIGRKQTSMYQLRNLPSEATNLNEVVEHMDVNQGKLNLGLRANITFSDIKYPAALMYNGVLGGYPHSKLFMNVREKASLAYYASSRLDGHKGILTIQTGIEIENYNKALEIIRQQLNAMKNGEISELEIEQTRAMISNHLRESQDAPFEIISFDFNSVLSGYERTPQSLIQEIEQVNTDMIQHVAQQVKLDTIYFLRDRKGEDNANN